VGGSSLSALAAATAEDAAGDLRICVEQTPCEPLPTLRIAPQSLLKLVIFDFDCTLTICHIYASLAGNSHCPNAMITLPPPHMRTECGQMLRLLGLDADLGSGAFALRAFGGIERLKEIHHMLQTLRDAKVECIILSRSMVGPIQKCLDQLSLLEFFSCIYGSTGSTLGTTDFDHALSPSSIPQEEHHYLGTPEMETGVAKADRIAQILKARGLGFVQAVFLDDDIAEVNSAKDVCRTIHISGGLGLREAEVSTLQEMFDEGFASELQSCPDSTSAGSSRSSTNTPHEEAPTQGKSEDLELMQARLEEAKMQRKSAWDNVAALEEKLKETRKIAAATQATIEEAKEACGRGGSFGSPVGKDLNERTSLVLEAQFASKTPQDRLDRLIERTKMQSGARRQESRPDSHDLQRTHCKRGAGLS
jgi:phosphoglycolate phosphatase-like HAD superfamily hydrolase